MKFLISFKFSFQCGICSSSDHPSKSLSYFQIPGDVKKLMRERSAKLGAMGLTLQPSIVVVGESLCAITAIYVCINDVMFLLPDIVKALDVCFKAFFVLNAQYPKESEQIWFVIQAAFYGIQTSHDKKTSSLVSVNAFLADLKRQ